MAKNNNTKTNGKLFSSLFSPKEIICHTDLTDRDTILKELLRLLALERGIGNVEEAYHVLLERENDMPSVAGPGIALPHARLDGLGQMTVGIVTSREGFSYTGDGKNIVYLLIMILAPKADPDAYLQTLSSLAKICQDPEAAGQVSAMDTPEDIWNFFSRGGLVLPDYLMAYDIMDPVQVKLNEYDTLEKAIDLFVRYERDDLPVVDKDGDLIGVVTCYELLRVCLPDYILWMDDLTPILNFQPFAAILRNESKTWLTEIMTNEYATVAVDAPAVQVAKEITRQRTERAYVLKGKTLVGVVSLARFLRKVLRE